MSVGLGTYGSVYRQIPEVGSPPGDWLISLTEFQFDQATDYDCVIVRGSGYVTAKTTTTVKITSPSISGDGVLEVRIVLRRDLRLWDDIPGNVGTIP